MNRTFFPQADEVSSATFSTRVQNLRPSSFYPLSRTQSTTSHMTPLSVLLIAFLATQTATSIVTVVSLVYLQTPILSKSLPGAPTVLFYLILTKPLPFHLPLAPDIFSLQAIMCPLPGYCGHMSVGDSFNFMGKVLFEGKSTISSTLITSP